ncbi:MAG: replicative helicase loader/inhibitor, partial [Clostridia bacterium]|nr:replicative helicase loader/inhibitor [Clostridia bacterium]
AIHMVELEMCKLMTVIAAAYPRFEVDEFKSRVWLEMLGDLPYEVAQMAVKKLIMESQYPPTIADVRQQVASLIEMSSGVKDEAAAWGEVTRAIKLLGYYREEEALASLSPMTAKVVRMIGWKEICQCEKVDVMRGQFLKMYHQHGQRERQNALLPKDFKEALVALSESMSFEGVRRLTAAEQEKFA